jgi:7-cyano-7-deazaguanine synthase in queuosine biosynthesis
MDIVLLNSGGIDSRVSAAFLSEHRIHSLYIDWNPRNSIEAQRAAEITAATYCVDHTVLPWGADWMVNFPILGAWGHPFTNLTGLSVAAAYTRYLEAGGIASGVRAEVTRSPEWRTWMLGLLNSSAISGSIELFLPVFGLLDERVTDMAMELDVDLSTTWSCSSATPACRRCRSCRRREVALFKMRR